ncbi:nucleoside recognition domain-containing protein [Paenibacillus sp. GP183]|uniref:nucleoside recognition domain-containing protein n=1 Tax=Paenibacillus sp. GP183 TaxID=1882751 RepID=UPI00089525EC|nr:nucleoside recognition domain-containing protein [Paenibacillus sp. GP183]SEB45072.1 sporulation integral membrane protein YlbJ [Paenibacillus sp. GP183]
MKLREKSAVLSRSKTLALSSMAICLVIIIILFPDSAFQSSLQGLTIWWELVFPALLPFLILTELLIGFGAVQAAGTIMEPLMRLLFRLPGASGWPLASSLIIGFPIGAKITAALREKELLSRQEAQRLVSITHLCSPLFVISVVGVGFLHQARLGLLLAVVHYLSAILTGWLMSRKHNTSHEPTRISLESEHSLWRRSLHTMQQAYLHDGRAFGKLLGDAVSTSVQTLMMIGGYMMIYSVMINVFTNNQLIFALQQLTTGFLGALNLGPELVSHVLSGLFEIHLGTYSLAQLQDVPLLGQMALISALLAWGGLSAHAQVGGFIHQTDIRYFPFFLARCLQAAIAFLLTFILWNPLQLLINQVEPSFLPIDFMGSSISNAPFNSSSWHAWQYSLPILAVWLLALGIMLLLSTIVWGFRKRA